MAGSRYRYSTVRVAPGRTIFLILQMYKVRTAAGKTLSVDGVTTWGGLKKQVAAAWPDDFPESRQRYIHAGNPVTAGDGDPLDIPEGTQLHLLKKVGATSSGRNNNMDIPQQPFRSVGPSARQHAPSGTQQVRVVVPAGASVGTTLRVAVAGRQYDVIIPAGCFPGSQFIVNIPA